MFPLKRFIKGPSLHDEVVSYEKPEKLPNQGPLTGEEVSKAYEEIISLPSTAASTGESSSSESQLRNFSSSSSSSSKKSKKAPTLSSLMSLCESDNVDDLENQLNSFPHEINIDALDEYGWTLLMSASCAGAVSCVTSLLQKGANWNIEDKKGLTALLIARKNRREAVCDLLQEWDICFRERLKREREQVNAHSPPIIEIDDDNDNCSSSKIFCEACQIHFENSKETHENSIAHLVSTSQFGKDRVHFGIPESNKGFQLMVKGGWDASSGLGPDGRGQKFPVKTVLKRNKLGLGNEKERKAARITHFGPFDSAAVEAVERLEREVTVRRREAIKSKSKEKRKEINYRREFSSL